MLIATWVLLCLAGSPGLLDEEVDQDVNVKAANERDAVEAVEHEAPVRQLELGPNADTSD